ncbi:MAG TPA: TolC family protein [Pirellulaceae bacterium]|nr:TolC family protein [Pirellulaceae bacterium]
MRIRGTSLALALGLSLCLLMGLAPAQELRRFIYPEQRQIEVRSPSQISGPSLPVLPAPSTVSQMPEHVQVWALSLDDAIRITLENAEVVRVLVGTQAVTSGSTIYDPAITNTQIDQSRAVFDPTIFSRNTATRADQPQGFFTNGFPPDVQINSTTTDRFQSSNGVSKQFATGTTASASVNAGEQRSRTTGLPLNPQNDTTTELRLAQPLLQGAGAPVNLAPILISRINTERSFYQLKDSVQLLVSDTVAAYWNLAFAEANAWARRQQVEQGLEALERAQARLRAGLGDESEVAQARVSYDQFRANSIGAEANLLQQEAALRNLLGLPPSDGRRIESVTPLNTQRLQPEWDIIRTLAEQNRPDLIERRLLLETDQQQLILARNRTLPELDAGAAYRWNTLEGRAFNGTWLNSQPGQFSEWEYGLNLSMPLGQRNARALLRAQELNLMRDRANLQQTLHSTNHLLAASVRNLAQYYDQYQAFRRTREAARDNLDRQMADYLAGRRTLYLNVLQAITDWGNALSSEVNSLALYNAELARLERETGIILENHGIQFVEEYYGSVGPLGRFAKPVCYPAAEAVGPNSPQPLPPTEAQYHLKDVLRLPPVYDEVPAAPPERLPAPPAESSRRTSPPARVVR